MHVQICADGVCVVCCWGCRGVHARVKIEQYRYILQSEGLDVAVVLSPASRPHRRGSEVDVVTTIRAASSTMGAGEVVWECTNTFLFFHKTGAALDCGGSTHEEACSRCQSARNEAFTACSGEHLTETARQTLVLEENLGRVYARLCSDFNPIHIYGWAARMLGFRRVIAHGMCVLGRALRAMDLAVAGRGQNDGQGLGNQREGGRVSLEVRFKKPLLLPGEAEVRLYRVDRDGATGGTADDELRFWIGPLDGRGGAFQEGRYVVGAAHHGDPQTS